MGGMPGAMGAPSPPQVTPPGGPSPMGGGPQEGLKAQARVKLSQAGKLLVDALAVLKGDLGSDEGKAIVDMLRIAAKVTPEIGEGMGQSELASMLAGAAPVRPGQAPPGMLGIPAPRPAVMAGPPMGRR